MRRGNINNKVEKENIDIGLNENANIDLNVNNDITIDVQKQVEKDNVKQENNKEQQVKGKNTVKIILLIIICVILIGVTAGLLIYKYNSNVINIEDKPSVLEPENSIKGNSNDGKYLVEFSDTYTYNPITIKDVEYKEGSIKIDGEKQDKVAVSYVQISGLVNTEIQDKINKEIKDAAFSLNKNLTAKQQYGTYTSVEGNFANILSVQISAYVYENNEAVKEQEIFLNFNLATGEKIKFLDLFADNTPMNSIIYDLKYEALAWDTEINMDMSEKEWDKATNMDKRDTSEYEDIILQAINRYKKLDKDKIEFFVTPNRIVAHLGINEGGEVESYVIDIYKYAEYITLFKKFLTDKVIYENIPKTKALVFNDYLGYIPEYYQTDNLFLCTLDCSHFQYEQEVEQDEIEKYSSQAVNMKKKLLKEFEEKIVNEVKKIASKNSKKGYVARFLPFSSIDTYSNDYGEEAIICINFYGALEEMSKEYFDSNVYRLLAKQNASPKVSIDDALVGALDYNDKNIKDILYDKDYKPLFALDAYYTLDGKFIANSYEDVEKYIDNKYKEVEQEVEVYKEGNI